MKPKLATALLAVSTFFAACRAPIIYDTPSGKPEVTVHAPLEDARSSLLNAVCNTTYAPVQQTGNQLVFERSADDTIAMMLLSTDYDSRPCYRLTFTLVPVGSSTRVICNLVGVSNPGSGFERTKTWLDTAGGKWWEAWLNQWAAAQQPAISTVAATAP